MTDLKRDNATVIHSQDGRHTIPVHRNGATILLDGMPLTPESVKRLAAIVDEAMRWEQERTETAQS